MLEFASGPKQRGSFEDNIACAKGDQPPEGDLHAVLVKTEVDILQNTKN